MIDAVRLVLAAPLLLASGLTDNPTLFNVGARIAGSQMRRSS